MGCVSLLERASPMRFFGVDCQKNVDILVLMDSLCSGSGCGDLESGFRKSGSSADAGIVHYIIR